eukprot:CAMPEP_0172488236 /NCGR_PEP_ID=MMETSP1066-20121228/17669_1 /TAXON_ID=671091 /ORGANISM="Coscinodiscus wailesii, Strain CCMP2513" /LENGTH=340 /DNA_ID=CAMNT_0013255333 /DNA_START=44 /DNA_END=1063 /DNA_ORIENTATION=+
MTLDSEHTSSKRSLFSFKRPPPKIILYTAISCILLLCCIKFHEKQDAVVAASPADQANTPLTASKYHRHLQQNEAEQGEEGETEGDELAVPPPIQDAAIATLVTNEQDDLNDLCLMLKSLVFLKGGYGGSFIRGGPTGMFSFSPVLVFNEGNLSLRQMQRIEGCTSRRVSFPVAYLNTYPATFNPHYEWRGFERWTRFRPRLGRRNWSYAQMIRFWTSTVWTHPAIQHFDTIMKMDADACFIRQRGVHFNPTYQEAPGLAMEKVYQTNYDGSVGSNRQFSHGLFDFAVDYMTKYGIVPMNPKMWSIINATWHEQEVLPVFQTSFEIVRRSFIQQKMVKRW